MFFYAPILLTIFPGLFYLKKRTPEFFIPILIYFPLSIYINSSWSCWWFGGSFGARAFVESLPIFAISLGAFYEGIRTIVGKRILLFAIFSCVVFSIWLMLKYWTGIIPFDGVKWNYFVETFFILKK